MERINKEAQEIQEAKSLKGIEENLNNFDRFREDHNCESDLRSEKGSEIAEKLGMVNPSLEDSMKVKQETVNSFSEDAQRVVDEQLEDQSGLENLADDMNQNLDEKTSIEAENINTIQSGFAAAGAGGFQTEILSNFIDEHKEIISEIRDYQTSLIETTNRMIDVNKEAFNRLQKAVTSIK